MSKYRLRPSICIRHFHLLLCHNRREHAFTASRARQLTRRLFDARTVIGIGSFLLVTNSNSIRLALSELILISFPDLIQLLVHVFIYDSIITTTNKNGILQKTTNNSSTFSNIKYILLIHLWLTYHVPSHFIIQFILGHSREEHRKFSVSISGSCYPKITFSAPMNQSVFSYIY